jgi:hypothetical protein
MTLFLLLLSTPSMLWAADEVSVQARLSESKIYFGERVRLELRVNGVREIEAPDIQLPDIDVTALGGQSFSNSSITIINGRTTRLEDFGYIANYDLRPRKAGTLRLPPVVVSYQGKTYASQPLQLWVREPAEQDLLLVDVFTDKPAYVLGERVTVTLEVSLRKLMVNGRALDIDPFFREQPPHIRIPWFEGLGEWKTSDLKSFVRPYLQPGHSGFYINDYYDERSFFRSNRLTFTLPRHETRRERPHGTFRYFTYRLQKTFRPTRAGVETIPPVLVRGTLPVEIDTRGRASQTERVVASSQPVTVEIRPVPSQGQPPGFNGAVGRFHLQVSAEPTHLQVGDPLTLTVTVHGEQDSLLDTVRPLALQKQATLDKDFKIHTDPPQVKTEQQSKTFTYTIRPRRADVRAVPAIEMAYYEPESGRFKVLSSDPIPIQVEAAVTMSDSEVVVTSKARPANTLGQQLGEGLLANYTGDDILTPQHAEVRLTPLRFAAFLLPPLAYLVMVLIGWLMQRRQSPELLRRKRAARTALNALRQLKQHRDGHEAEICEGVRSALLGYVGDKLNLTSAGLTVDDVTQQMSARRLEQDLIERTEHLLHLCDGVRYAPGTLAVVRLNGLVERAESLVQRLEKKV